MRRPTISDLAEAAGVSVATVNRVLAGSGSVRAATREKVSAAAAAIGFYGLGAIQSRNAAQRPKYRFGVILLQPHRPFYRLAAAALREAAEAVTEAEVEVVIEHLEDLTPQNTAARALALAETCQAVALTSDVHPVITQAIEAIQAAGTPIFAFIAQQPPTTNVHYVGLDNWKVGRTAAWCFAHMCKTPGKIGILLGNHRYRNQEMNETGFRSYFREFAPDFTLLNPRSTFESAAVGQELTEGLLHEHPDLVGLYITGGGISGALAALRARNDTGDLVTVGYELMDNTRAALVDGVLTLVIAHPLRRMAETAIEGMMRAVSARGEATNINSIVPFEIYTRENI